MKILFPQNPEEPRGKNFDPQNPEEPKNGFLTFSKPWGSKTGGELETLQARLGCLQWYDNSIFLTV